MVSGPGIVLLNVFALCLLLVCLRYGIHRERNDVLVWTRPYSASTVGFSFLNLENSISRHVWNQLVAAGGLLVGGLTFIAFQLHERHLRHASGRRSVDRRKSRDRKLPLLSRPPTRRSNAEGCLSLNSATLFGLILSSVLASTAAVAALGMNLRPFSASSPIPKQRTRDLRSQVQFVPSTDMTAIVYQSALLRAVSATSGRFSTSNNHAIDNRPPRIGCANYPDLRTRGVGVKPAGVAEAGPLNLLAPGLIIHSLQGVTMGTNMSAVCRDESSDWSGKHKQVSPLRYESTFSRHQTDGTEDPAPRRLTMAFRDPGEVVLRSWLEDSGEDDPPRLRQMFVLSRIGRRTGDSTYTEKDAAVCLGVAVLACDYSGQDVRHLIRVNGDSSPITFLEELGAANELSWSDMRPAARAISSVIENGLPGGGNGGVLMAGLAHGGLRGFSEFAKVDKGRLLEEILTDAAQGYFSVWRQRVEWWSVGSNKATPDGWVKGLALRVGGGGWFWVGIMAVLTSLPLVALFRMARAWDRTGELLLSEICSDDGLSEDEDQAMFITQLAPKHDSPPAYSD